MEKKLEKNLWDIDQELFQLIKNERKRQSTQINLLANENITSRAVLQCLSSTLINKSNERQFEKISHGSNIFIDEIESLAQKRALKAFNLNPQEWGCNVQPYSGSAANLAVCLGLLKPHARIMGLDFPDGGYYTQDCFTTTKKISVISKFFETMPYKVDHDTGLIDYNRLRNLARVFKPNMIIAGGSSYNRFLDYKIFKDIAVENNAYLVSDMSHISGFLAAGLTDSNPFEYSDIVTTTTHKTLRGPYGGIIFYRKGKKSLGDIGKTIMYDFEERINQAVYPGLQSSPNYHVIAGIATVMNQTKSQDFKKYQMQVRSNAIRLCNNLITHNFKIVTDGTDTHFFIINFHDCDFNGVQIEMLLKMASFICSVNTVSGDIGMSTANGIRLSTLSSTSRNCDEHKMDNISHLLNICFKLGTSVSMLSEGSTDIFKDLLIVQTETKETISMIRNDVEAFQKKLPELNFKDY